MRYPALLILILFFVSCKRGTTEKHDLPPAAREALAKDDPFLPDTAWLQYCNKSYGYCIDYPQNLFDAQPESDLGDGRVFLDKQGREALRVFGRNNSDPDLKHYSLEEQLAEDTTEFKSNAQGAAMIVYHKVGKTFAVFSGTRDGMVYYQKTIPVGKDLAFAVFRYPVADKATYDAIIARMAASFH